ncbi:hypothetical protein EVA_14259, partial [gut metagenome]
MLEGPKMVVGVVANLMSPSNDVLEQLWVLAHVV